MLLTTKLHIPVAPPSQVQRPHLLACLSQGQGRHLTLISAPAGAGKTSLLSAWVEQLVQPVAWVSLENDDNDPARFLSYVIAAIQHAEIALGVDILAALQSAQPPQAVSVLPYLINDIAALPNALALVLDDYHVIKTSAVHDLMIFLLDHLPSNLHVIIATRADPPFPLARWRGRQQLMELRTTDLRFTDSEAATFLNHMMQLDLSIHDINVLNARIEGWITGLQMAALSVKGRDDKSDFVRTFTGSNRYILDYLVEEVLHQQPGYIQSFLLQTSILNRLSGELCRAVTGNDESQLILEELERANLFVIPLDDQLQWFRYHHLFADLLRQRLQTLQPDCIVDLHRRASSWYEENGLLTQSIEHLLTIDDHQQALHLITQYAETVWDHGNQTQLAQWLAELPEEVLSQHPALLAHYAFLLCTAGQFESAETQLALAESCAKADDNLTWGISATVRAYIAIYNNDVPTGAGYVQQARQLLPPEYHIWHCAIELARGDTIALLGGSIPASEQALQKALYEAEAAGSAYFSLVVSTKLSMVQKQRGKLRQAVEVVQAQLNRATERGFGQATLYGTTLAVWGNVLVEWNQLDEAIKNIQRSLTINKRQNYMVGIAWGYLSLIHAYFARGDWRQVEEFLNQFEQQLHRQTLPLWTVSFYFAWRVRFLIAQRDLIEAERIVHDRALTVEDEFTYPGEVEYLAFARLLIAKGQAQSQSVHLAEASHLLNRLNDHFEDMGWIDTLIETRVLQTITLQAQYKNEAAIRTLVTALTLAKPGGYVHTFIGEGAAITPLLYTLSIRGIESDYVKLLLAACPAAIPSISSALISLIEPVSDRELEVLHMIAQGATNQETALALHIAVGTVKNHLKNIYRKLDVRSRTQAVARSRELGILD